MNMLYNLIEILDCNSAREDKQEMFCFPLQLILFLVWEQSLSCPFETCR